ncbi:MAG: hypothetical protein KAH86_05570, partial [Methanosarcinales archaeon]|nr:hypothetical protein [Methanosarcinales archaeon]
MGLRDKAKQKKVVESPVEVPEQQTPTSKAASVSGGGLRDRAKALTNEASAPSTDSNADGTGKLQRDELINHIMRNKMKMPMPGAKTPSPDVAKEATPSTTEVSPIELEGIVEDTDGVVAEEPENAEELGEKIDDNREDFIKRVGNHRDSANLVREAYGISKSQREGLTEGEESTEASDEDEQTAEYKEKLFDRIVKSGDSRDAVFEFASKQISEEKLEEITVREAAASEEHSDDVDVPIISPEKQ